MCVLLLHLSFYLSAAAIHFYSLIRVDRVRDSEIGCVRCARLAEPVYNIIYY